MLIIIPATLPAQTTKAQLETSETLFALAASLNSCGYDAGMESALPVRQAVRTDIQAVLRRSAEAAAALKTICDFESGHVAADAGRSVSQYVSLALDLGQPPDFKAVVPVADLPPDAAEVQGVAPLLQKFYAAAGLHQIWQQHQSEYSALVTRFHDPVAEVITRTDLYLKLPFSNYVGRRFVIYLEPLLASSQVNSRNYGDNYFLVVSPSRESLESGLRLHEIRHTYLHYVLDPMALRYGYSLRRLEPLLENVQNAPMDKSFKHDISLLVTESLIRAVEARQIPATKSDERARLKSVDDSMAEGFVLTHYFYETLAAFEKDPTGLRDSYGTFLYNIELNREKKRAAETVFASQASPEVVSASRKTAHEEERLLDTAEQRLTSGDPAGAQQLALQVVNNPNTKEDQGRALFILARAATLSGDVQGAQAYFQRAIDSAHDPRTLAWSHIYLGRILDIQENRDAALQHYRAALAAGDPTPDTKIAAEKGLASPYQPRTR